MATLLFLKSGKFKTFFELLLSRIILMICNFSWLRVVIDGYEIYSLCKNYDVYLRLGVRF